MEPQAHRPNPQRPTVRPSSHGRIGMWEARGYDQQGNFHCAVKFTLPEVFSIATTWAKTGYGAQQ